MTLFATDDAGRLCGSLTDGDVRRALLAGQALDSTVGQAMQTDFTAIRQQAVDAALIRRARLRGLKLLPVIDSDYRPVGVIDLQQSTNLLPVSAVLMAGGKGERLRPLTLTTPKPLLEIEGKAIIDYNIEALAKVGISDITVTTRYLADAIDRHFSQPIAGVQVRTVRETNPLGTIGAVSLCHLPDRGTTLVMNSDLLTTISFEDMYLHHVDSEAAVTIAAIPYQVSVPFAILDIDGDRVQSLSEKPSYSYFANAGIYLFDNKVFGLLQPGVPTDAPDLIAEVIARGMKVTYFPISGSWIDVGTPADFRQAAELMRHHKNFSRH